MKYVLTYGIACVKEDGNNKELLTGISDVTTDPVAAKKLVELLNENQLSPNHLADIVDDLLDTV